MGLPEIQSFVNSNNSIYLDHKKIGRREFEKNGERKLKKNLYVTLFLRHSYFKLITYSKDKKKFELSWIRKSKYIQSNFLIHIIVGKEVKDVLGTSYFSEANKETLNQIESQYKIQKVLITDNCPACGVKILREDIICENCGINLSLE
jgi:hypothetical protein